jgi:hypothetical protein
MNIPFYDVMYNSISQCVTVVKCYMLFIRIFWYDVPLPGYRIIQYFTQSNIKLSF